MKHLFATAILAGALALPVSAFAADYTIMAPAGPGGGWDQTARSMQEAMTTTGISGNVQVVNVPGAGGTIGSDFVRRQPADGHAILLATPSTHGTVPALQPDTTPYDPIADFTAIAVLGRAPIALAVRLGLQRAAWLYLAVALAAQAWVVAMVVAVVLMHQSQILTLNNSGGWSLELQAFYFFTALVVLLTAKPRG